MKKKLNKKEKLALLILGMLFFELLRVFIPIDRLANEIQIISATPFLYAIYKAIKDLHSIGHTTHQHIHIHHNGKSPEALASEIQKRLKEHQLKHS